MSETNEQRNEAGAAGQVTLHVNGTSHDVRVGAHDTLLDVLRRRLHLYGCREACGIGVCGACTVLVNGRAVSSCLLPAFSCHEAAIATVEGLAGAELHPVQRAFIEEQGFQCSFCTPGFVMSLVAMLAEPPERRDVEAALSGHLCRCGSYRQIRAAVSRILQEEQAGQAGQANAGHGE
ncbi:MAG TPA: (2Fe-2S)-binding protein [Trebonia sp.]|nr:(2Fe-2S)-binding protein [Trebonia sp.]